MSTLLGASSSSGVVLAIIGLAVMLFELVAVWKVFTKAGRHGWAVLIPIYNGWTLCKAAKRPGWWVFLFLVPLLNIVIGFIVLIDLAKAFGKGTGFGVLSYFFGFITMPILGFGSATYRA